MLSTGRASISHTRPFFVAAFLSVFACIGCSTFQRPHFLSMTLKSKTPTPSAASSPMSQLGVALPAMKPGEDRKLSVLAGQRLATNGYWDEAVEQFRMAEELGPDHSKLDAELAPALAATRQYAESLERYRRLLKAAPKDVELRNNYAWTLMESGDLSAADAEYRDVLKAAPDHQRSQINLGIVLAKQQRYPEALAQLHPTIGELAAWHNIGVIAIDLGDEETATQALERAASSDSAPVESQQLLAALRSSSKLH